MENIFINKAKKLLEQGNKFNYDNFCLKGKYGHPNSINSEYILWRNLSENFIAESFGDKSILYRNFLEYKNFRIIGNEQDEFQNSHNIIIACLNTAVEELEFRKNSEINKEEITFQNKKVFIVHGHDEVMKDQLLILLKEIGLEPIVLHRQVDEGSSTVIEKFEKYSKDVGYAFVLLTPDDIAYSSTEENLSEKDRKKEARARQNVIFELGYSFALLGRKRVTCLYKKGVTVPSDIKGVICKEIINNVEEKGREIMRELKSVGYQVQI